MTNIPSGEMIRLISEEIGTDEPDSSMSLLDVEAVTQYELQTRAEEAQTMREQVKQSFVDYLQDALDATAVDWLELHLQGFSQDDIAQQLHLSTKEAYRLREKNSLSRHPRLYPQRTTRFGFGMAQNLAARTQPGADS